MSERIEKFAVTDHPAVEIRVPAGDISLHRGEPEEITIRLEGSDASLEGMTVEELGGTVVVRSEKGKRWRLRTVNVIAIVPEGCDARIKTASGVFQSDASLATLDLDMASGDIRVATVAEAWIKSAAGDVVVEEVSSSVDVGSASGDIRLGDVAGDVSVKSASGDVGIDYVGGMVNAKTASGDLDVRSFAGDSFSAKTMSGGVRLGIPPGRRLEVDIQALAGEIRNELPPPSGKSDQLATIRIKTMSGDVVLQAAR